MPVYQVEPTKDGRSWIFMVYKKDYNGNNKKYKSKRFKTKSEAKDEERLFLMKKTNPLHKSFKLVANDYFKYMYETRKESTVYTYENIYNKNILPFFKNLNIDEITVQQINNWKNELLQKNFKLNYLNKLHTVLKNIFDFGIKNYGLSYNPVTISGRFQRVNEDIKDDEEKLKYITYDNFNKFIFVIDDITWKTFFIFLYYTGMRKGEVQALKIKDIDFDTNEIIVNKTLSVKTRSDYKITNTKNYINRKIKMSKILNEQLKEYLNYLKKTYSDYNEDWFLFGCTRFLPSTTIDNRKHYYFSLSNQEEITIHQFRHSHVSLLVNQYIQSSKEKNMKIDTTKFFIMVGNRLGHSTRVMQETYLHLFPTVQDEIVDLLDNL